MQNRKIEIRLTDKKAGVETTTVAEFPPEEIEMLHAYYNYVEELSGCKWLKDGAPANLKMNYAEGRGMSFAVQLPPDDDVIIFLYRLRPLILNDEHASYNAVTGIIGRRFADAHIRAFLKQQRELYDGRSMQQQIQIQADGVIINSEKVLNTWLNSFEYHREQDKKKEIERLHALLPLEASRAIFLMLLSHKALAIFNVAHLVGLLLKKKETLEISLKSRPTSSAQLPAP
jgi:hypothetical protein